VCFEKPVQGREARIPRAVTGEAESGTTATLTVCCSVDGLSRRDLNRPISQGEDRGTGLQKNPENHAIQRRTPPQKNECRMAPVLIDVVGED